MTEATEGKLAFNQNDQSSKNQMKHTALQK